jgi:hypothetical protein
MDVPTREAREPLKTALFKGEMRVRQDASSRSLCRSGPVIAARRRSYKPIATLQRNCRSRRLTRNGVAG